MAPPIEFESLTFRGEAAERFMVIKNAGVGVFVRFYRKSPFNAKLYLPWNDEYVMDAVHTQEAKMISIPAVVLENREEVNLVLANRHMYEKWRGRVMWVAALRHMRADGDHAVAWRVLRCLVG